MRASATKHYQNGRSKNVQTKFSASELQSMAETLREHGFMHDSDEDGEPIHYNATASSGIYSNPYNVAYYAMHYARQSLYAASLFPKSSLRIDTCEHPDGSFTSSLIVK